MKFLKYFALIAVILYSGLANATQPWRYYVDVKVHTSADALVGTGDNTQIWKQAISYFRLYGAPWEFRFAGFTTDSDCYNNQVVITSTAYPAHSCATVPSSMPNVRLNVNSYLLGIANNYKAPDTYGYFGQGSSADSTAFALMIQSLAAVNGYPSLYNPYQIIDLTMGVHTHEIRIAPWTLNSTSGWGEPISVATAFAGNSNADCAKSAKGVIACVDSVYNRNTNTLLPRVFRIPSTANSGTYTGTCTSYSQTNCSVTFPTSITGAENQSSGFNLLQSIHSQPRIARDTTRNVLWLSVNSYLFTSSNEGVTWTYRGTIGKAAISTSYDPVSKLYSYNHSGGNPTFDLAYDVQADRMRFLVGQEAPSDGHQGTLRVASIPAGVAGVPACPTGNEFSCVIPVNPSISGSYTDYQSNWSVGWFTNSSISAEMGNDPTVNPSGYGTQLECPGLRYLNSSNPYVCYVTGTDGTQARNLRTFAFVPSNLYTNYITYMKAEVGVSPMMSFGQTTGAVGSVWTGYLDYITLADNYYWEQTPTDYPLYVARTTSGSTTWTNPLNNNATSGSHAPYAGESIQNSVQYLNGNLIYRTTDRMNAYCIYPTTVTSEYCQ